MLLTWNNLDTPDLHWKSFEDAVELVDGAYRLPEPESEINPLLYIIEGDEKPCGTYEPDEFGVIQPPTPVTIRGSILTFPFATYEETQWEDNSKKEAGKRVRRMVKKMLPSDEKRSTVGYLLRRKNSDNVNARWKEDFFLTNHRGETMERGYVLADATIKQDAIGQLKSYLKDRGQMVCHSRRSWYLSPESSDT